ncbi:MAG TPA: SRPBCC domain-containing protein [Stellaceae bacterium]|nr:SRPBCC domain-containing protein [Stellaceae bacterium]
MADILHKITISAPPAAVYAALTERQGLAGWWTEDVRAEPKIGAVARFRFGEDGGPDMEILDLEPGRRVHWRCIAKTTGSKDEWIGTEIFFELAPDGPGTVLRFSHRRWAEASDFLRYCSLKWATYLLGLKRLLEGGSGTPWPRDVKI